jgi:hypothetical protein
MPQCWNQVGKRYIPYSQQVDVALRRLLAGSDGTVERVKPVGVVL